MKTDAPLFSIGTKDLIKGFIVAVLTIILTGLMTSLSSGELPTLEVLKTLSLTGLGAGIAYVLKNFLTDSNDKFLGQADIKIPLIISFMLLTGVAFADTVIKVPFDSTKLHNEIVNTTNAIIATIPATNPLIEGLKIFFIAIGSGVTGWCIHFFKKKNAAK